MAKVTRPIANLNPITGQPILPPADAGYKFGQVQAGGGFAPWSDIDLSEFRRLVPIPVLTGDEAVDYARLTEERAQNQSTFEQYRNGVIKWAGKTATALIGGLATVPYTIGVAGLQLADIAIPGNVVKWSDIYNNAFQRSLDSANQWMDKNLPNYYTKAQQEMGLGRQMLTANFWANDFLGGMSFMTGAILSEITASYLTALTFGAAAPAQMMITQGILARTAKLMKMLQRTAPIDDVIKGYAALGKSGAAFQNIQGLRSIITGAGYEAGVEARHFIDEAERDMISSFVDAEGREPTAEEHASMMDRITRQANGVFATNLGLVGASNAAIFTKTFAPLRNMIGKALRMGPAPIAGGVLSPFVKEGEKLAAREIGNWEKALVSAYKLAKKPFIEGVWEEGLQGVTSSAAVDYVMKKYSHDGGDATYSMAEAITKGFEQAYGTKEGQKEVLIGAIMGLIGSPITRFEGSSIKDVVNYLRQGDANKAFAERYNNVQTLPTIQAAVKSTIRGHELNQEMDYAIDRDDFFKAKNAEDDGIFNLLQMRYDSGYLDQVVDDFDDAVRDYLANSEEDGYKKMAADFGFDPSTSVTEMKDRLKEVRAGLEMKVEAFRKAKQNAKDALIRPDADLEEGLTYTLYNIGRKSEREKEVASEIQRIVGDVDTRELEDIRNSNLSILFSRNWKKTFESERGNLLDEMDTMEKDLAEARQNYDKAQKKFEDKIKRLGKRRTPKTAKEIEDINKLPEEQRELLRYQETGYTQELLDIESSITKLEDNIEKQRKKIAAKVAKEYQDRNNTSIPYDMDSVEFENLVDRALALRKKLEVHYKSNPVNKKKLKLLFDDLHRLSAYRQRQIMEYNMLVSQPGAENFLENVAELRSLIEQEINSGAEAQLKRADKLFANKARVKKLIARYYSDVSPETKDALLETFKSYVPTADEMAVEAATRQGPDALNALIEGATKVSAGHQYVSNLFRTMPQWMRAGNAAMQAEKQAAEQAVQQQQEEPKEEGGIPVPPGSFKKQEGAAPISPSTTTEGAVKPPAGFTAPGAAKSFVAEVTEGEKPPEGFTAAPPTAPPAGFTAPTATPPPKGFTAGEPETKGGRQVAVTNPNELLWIWNDYPEARNQELWEESFDEATGRGIREYPDATKKAMRAYTAKPKASNLQLRIEEWNPAAENLEPEVRITDDVVMMRTYLRGGKHWRARLFVREDANDEWHEVGSLLNPKRYVNNDGVPFDLTDPEQRSTLNPAFKEGEQGEKLSTMYEKLTKEESLWSWIDSQIDKGGATVTGTPLQVVFGKSDVHVKMFNFSINHGGTVMRWQEKHGGQSIEEKFPPDIYGREVTIKGKKTKAIIYIDKKTNTATGETKFNYTFLHYDEDGNRMYSEPTPEQSQEIYAEDKALRENKQNKAYRVQDKIILFEYDGHKEWSGVMNPPVDAEAVKAVDAELERIFTKDEEGLYPHQREEEFEEGKGRQVALLPKDEDRYISVLAYDNASGKGNLLKGIHISLQMWVNKLKNADASKLLGGPTSYFNVELGIEMNDTWVNFIVSRTEDGVFYMEPKDSRGVKYRTYIGPNITMEGILNALHTEEYMKSAPTKSKIANYLEGKAKAWGVPGFYIKGTGYRQGNQQGRSVAAFDALALMSPNPSAFLDMDLKEEEEIGAVQEFLEGQEQKEAEEEKKEEVPAKTEAPATKGFTVNLQSTRGEDDDVPFKIVPNVSDKELTTFDEAKANIQSILNIDVKDIDTVVGNIANKGITVGAFMSNVVYLSKKALPKGTEWHEAFHVVFRTFLSNSQISHYLGLARERYTLPSKEALEKFREQAANRKDLTAKQLEDLWLEEKMADDFADFQAHPASYTRTKKHNNAFVRLWNELLKWLGLYSEHADEIEALFSDISIGKFRTATPVYNIFRLRKEAAWLNYPTIEIAENDILPVFDAKTVSSDVHMLAALVYRQLTAQGIDGFNKYHISAILDTMRDRFNPERWDKRLGGAVDVAEADRNALYQRLIGIHNAISHPGQTIFALDNNGGFGAINFEGNSPESIAAYDKRWQKTYDANLEEILKDIKLMSVIYQQDEVLAEDANQADYEESEEDSLPGNEKKGDRYGGLSSTSKAFRQYILTTYGEMDYFELGIGEDILKADANKELFLFPANPGILYNGILAALRDTPIQEVMSRFVVWSRDNKNSRLLAERLFSDIKAELKQNGIAVRDIEDYLANVANVATLIRNSNTFNLFINNFTKHSREYLDLILDPTKTHTLISPMHANQQDSDAMQVNRWRAKMARAYEKAPAGTPFFGQNNVLHGVLQDIQAKFEFFSGKNVDKTVREIKALFDSIGIEVAPGYIRYSLYRNKANEFEALDPNDETADSDFIKFGRTYDSINEPTIAEELGGLTEVARGGTVQVVGDFFTSEKGALSRLMKLARTNTLFDETLFRTSIQNSNGERVFPISSPSFVSTMSLLLRDRRRRAFVDAMRVLAANPTKANDKKAYQAFTDSMGSELGLEPYFARRYFDNIKNNPLLLGLTNDGSYDNRISEVFLNYFIDYNLFGVRLDFLEEVEETGEVVRETWKQGYREGADYSDLDAFSKLVAKMSFYIDSTGTINRAASEAIESKKEVLVPFRVVVPAVLEAKKTANAFAVPVLKYTRTDKEKGLVLSDIGKKVFKAHLQREVDNLNKTKAEIAAIIKGDKIENIVEKYHYIPYNDSKYTYQDGTFYEIVPKFIRDEYGAPVMDSMQVTVVTDSKLIEDLQKELPKLRGLRLFDMRILPNADEIEKAGVIPKDIDDVIDSHMQSEFHKFVQLLRVKHRAVVSDLHGKKGQELLAILNQQQAFKDAWAKISRLPCK